MSSTTCTATCSGFSTLRGECIANPCMADNLCQISVDPTITNCAAWCCQSRGGTVFLMVILFCLGAFLSMAAYYVHRLHEENVKSGAVTADGKRITAVQQKPETSAKHRLRAVFTPQGPALAPA